MDVVVGDANVVLVKDFYARTVVFYFAIYIVGCVISFHNMLIFRVKQMLCVAPDRQHKCSTQPHGGCISG